MRVDIMESSLEKEQLLFSYHTLSSGYLPVSDRCRETRTTVAQLPENDYAVAKAYVVDRLRQELGQLPLLSTEPAKHAGGKRHIPHCVA
ncbi:hypothetical protein BDZ97DRAFT_1804393 [Flammula alnicola]|nr:hypothetical protein BDZ97DRAFT_1804393 [Flammula alnicola]